MTLLSPPGAGAPAEPDYAGVPVPELLQRNALGAGDWVSLFNGHDLQGWTVKIRGYPAGDNHADTFRVSDGLLGVSYAGYDTFHGDFGHLFSDASYSHYILSLEYRFSGEQARGGAGWAFENSGIMLHSQSAASMGLDQDFPISVEVQLLGGTGRKQRPTANVCTPGTHIELNGKLTRKHCIDSTSATFPGEQWVRVDVVVLGGELIEHRVNGEPVLRYAHPVIGGGVVADYRPEMKPDGRALIEGHISLQSESHPVEFRRVELLDLRGCKDPQAGNYRGYLAVHDDASCAGNQ